MSLPRYAVTLEDQEKVQDDAAFFQALSQLDARDANILQEFMDNFRNTKIKVFGLSDCVRFHEHTKDSPEFEQFSLDVWREFYIQENIIQIALLDDKEPAEGLFVGATSGRVYICGQADDVSQQKVLCVAASLYKLIWRGPQQPVEYKTSCLFDGCYGCFDPVVRHRMFRFKQF